MNSNHLHYLEWRGDIPFSASPFNLVDASILCHLAYEHLEGLVSSSFKEQITIRQLSEDFLNSHNHSERIQMGFGINPKTPELLYAAGKSLRFGDVKICGLQEILSEEKCEQFAGMTFVIGNTAYITFRGTDDTVIGWCEDLLLGKSPILPSHIDGVEYCNKAAEYFKKDLVVLGHSKGGTVAVYAGTYTSPKVQKRIKAVYNLDGPGWYPDFYETENFKRIEDKVLSIYPECDIVGKVFYPNSNYIIIKAEGKGFDQHDMFNWQCIGPNHVPGEDYTEESKVFFKKVNEWYETVEEAKRIKFIETLADIYRGVGFKNNYDLNKNRVTATKNALSEFNKLDKETKDGIHEVLSVLRKVMINDVPMFMFLSESKEFVSEELPNQIKENAKKVVEKVQKVANDAHENAKKLIEKK